MLAYAFFFVSLIFIFFFYQGMIACCMSTRWLCGQRRNGPHSYGDIPRDRLNGYGIGNIFYPSFCSTDLVTLTLPDLLLASSLRFVVALAQLAHRPPGPDAAITLQHLLGS